MPVLVAGAGAALGGATAGWLNKLTGGNVPSAPVTLDVGPELSFLRQGTETATYYNQMGLGLYKNSLEQAREDMQSNFSQAAATLQPSAQASHDALNQMMRMMGMDPIQATSNYNTKLQGLGLKGDTSPIQTLINQANNERDPALRAQLKDQVVAALHSAPVVDNTDLNLRNVGPMPVYEWQNTPGAYPAGSKDAKGRSNAGKPIVDAGPRPMTVGTTANSQGKLVPKVDEAMRQNMINDANSNYQDELAIWKMQQNNVRADEAQQVQNRTRDKNNFIADFQNSYTPNYDAAYTGDEVRQKVEATPGYDFQLNQGTKAVQRQGAAAGMLGSGNTVLALQNYGEQQAQQYFNSYMGNLANIAQAGSGATSGLANLYTQQANAYSNLDTMKGSAEMGTYQTIGQIASQNEAEAAQYAYNTSKYNADYLEAQEAQKNAIAKQAVASGAGYMNANLAQQQFGYQVAQNQQGGQAYFSGGGGGGSV